MLCRIPERLTAPRMIHVKSDPAIAAATRMRATDTAACSRIRRRVLLVDDDSDFRQLLRAASKHGPYDLLTAPSARVALEILRKEIPDVVVADENIPGMSGTDLLAIVANEFPACG